jgi:hypothetical protein
MGKVRGAREWGIVESFRINLNGGLEWHMHLEQA